MPRPFGLIPTKSAVLGAANEGKTSYFTRDEVANSDQHRGYSSVGWISSAHPPFISANGGQTIKLFYSKYTEYLCITMSAPPGNDASPERKNVEIQPRFLTPPAGIL
ncbi:MAG: hypothetical protein D0531_09660 [Methylococcales bacterium]|nr:MAG: hypothetical protein D0531_09660 [Methylococcales bacterium]